MTKTARIFGIKRAWLKIIKIICYKSTADWILFSKISNKTRMQLSPFLFNIILEVLASVTRQEREIIGIQVVKKGKLSLITDSMLLHAENCKDAKKLIEIINKVNHKLQDTRLIYRNLLHFYTLIVAIRKRI